MRDLKGLKDLNPLRELANLLNFPQLRNFPNSRNPGLNPAAATISPAPLPDLSQGTGKTHETSPGTGLKPGNRPRIAAAPAAGSCRETAGSSRNPALTSSDAGFGFPPASCNLYPGTLKLQQFQKFNTFRKLRKYRNRHLNQPPGATFRSLLTPSPVPNVPPVTYPSAPARPRRHRLPWFPRICPPP